MTFLIVRFNVSHLFAHILNVKLLLSANTLGQSGPGSNSNEGVIHIPQSFKTGASPSDCLMSYPGHSLGVYSSGEIQSVYFTLTDEWAGLFWFIRNTNGQYE